MQPWGKGTSPHPIQAPAAGKRLHPDLRAQKSRIHSQRQAREGYVCLLLCRWMEKSLQSLGGRHSPRKLQTARSRVAFTIFPSASEGSLARTPPVAHGLGGGETCRSGHRPSNRDCYQRLKPCNAAQQRIFFSCAVYPCPNGTRRAASSECRPS